MGDRRLLFRNINDLRSVLVMAGIENIYQTIGTVKILSQTIVISINTEVEHEDVNPTPETAFC